MLEQISPSKVIYIALLDHQNEQYKTYTVYNYLDKTQIITLQT